MNRRGMRRFRMPLARAKELLMLGLAMTLIGCEAPPPESEPTVRPVRFARVATGGGASSRVFSGTVRAALESDLSFKVPGTLVSLPLAVGSEVGAGSVVASLDPTDYEVKRREAEAGLARAVAQQRNAEASYERTRGLYENRNVSRSDLDAARAAAESAAAQVRAARQQLEAARLQLSYTELRAPQDCRVAATPVEVNQNVQVGQTVVSLTCGDCPEVAISVPETYIEPVRAQSAARVIVDALGQREFDAIVTEVGVATARLGATFPVTVALKGQCDGVRSGMSANVRFQLDTGGTAGEGLVVPVVAVGEDRDGRFAFVLEPAGDGDRWQARRRPVEVGMPTPDGIEITAGLSEGELIATAGVRRLADGQIVTLLGEPETGH